LMNTTCRHTVSFDLNATGGDAFAKPM